MSGRALPAIACRIRRCEETARWVLTIAGHPNGDPPASAYCHEHAEQHAKLLWDGAPRPYTKTARGPFEPAALRAVLGPAGAAEHGESKRQQRLELQQQAEQ